MDVKVNIAICGREDAHGGYRPIRIMNLTPHELSIERCNGEMLCVPPSGQVARVAVENNFQGELQLKGEDDNINIVSLYRSVYGKVEGLPEPKDNYRYIVSRMVKDRVPDREDVYVPGAPIRDWGGEVIGCHGLSL